MPTIYPIDMRSHFWKKAILMYSDRFIDKKELRKIVPYSDSHVARLEKEGLFPRRVRIGPCRVAWSFLEVQTWIEEKKNRSEAA